MDLLKHILQAEHRIRASIKHTPLERSLPLSRKTGSEVYIKMENLQYTGSFKVRGAMNKMLALPEQDRQGGVVAASTGNHGAAVAFAADKLNIRSTVFVPKAASPAKVAAMERLGAEVCFHGEDSLEAEVHAREYARRNGKTYVSPYNDIDVVAGQGTTGIEIARDMPRVDRIFISVGGGGLIAGIGCYLKAIHPEVHVVACSPGNSCVMVESLQAGRILDLESKPTLSDGTAGGVETGAITFELCKDLIDDCVLVSEEEIATTMKTFIESHHMLIEGSAAVALAAMEKSQPGAKFRNNVVVLCGGNVSFATLEKISNHFGNRQFRDLVP
jgi:threonine dehydratase